MRAAESGRDQAAILVHQIDDGDNRTGNHIEWGKLVLYPIASGKLDGRNLRLPNPSLKMIPAGAEQSARPGNVPAP